MTRDERERYAKDICQLWRAVGHPVCRKDVAIGNWRPKERCCHKNVDFWVNANPGSSAVRGWIIEMALWPFGCRLTAHSVVRGIDGCLFDITPQPGETGHPERRFVAHVGDETEFWAVIGNPKNIFIDCPATADEMADIQAQLDAASAPTNSHRSPC